MKTIFFRALVVLAGLTLGVVLRADPVLVGHPDHAGQTLDADGIKAVLLGKRVTLGDRRVVLIIAKSGAAQEAFLQLHVGMSASQFQNYWRRLFMTGGGSAPKIALNEVEAEKLVAETAGAVAILEETKAAGLIVLGPPK